MEEISFDRLMELGGRHLADRDPDGAIHYYNTALRKDPAAPAPCLGLTRAFLMKAESGEQVFRVLALDAARKGVAADPSSDNAHSLLATAAEKANRLGDLAVEYREKLKRDPDSEVLKKRLKHIYIISLMDRKVKLPAVGYKPALFLKVFFDCVLLPFSTAVIIAANVLPRARPSMMIGVSFFFCYAVYRSIVFFFSRRDI